MNAFQVYRLYTFSEGSNAYGVARNERWTVAPSQAFETIQEAKTYIVQQSMEHTELPKYLLQWSETAPTDREVTREQVVEQYCFSNDQYMHQRRFFLGFPPTDKILKQLENQGIQVTITK